MAQRISSWFSAKNVLMALLAAATVVTGRYAIDRFFPAKQTVERVPADAQLMKDWLEAQKWNGDETGLTSERIAELKKLRAMTAGQLTRDLAEKSMLKRMGVGPETLYKPKESNRP